MAKKLKLTLIRSGINRPETQKATIRGLGLTKLGRTVVVPDNVAVRGMIRSVSHLVRVQSGDN
jgi:large subunit ribosomal protein L30